MRLLPALAVPLVALSFAGCATAPTDSTPQNAAVEQAPAFATDEEALAAAQAAYAEYLAVSDQIAREGGANPERLQGLVTKDQFKIELSPLEAIAKSGSHQEGNSKFDSIHLQDNDANSVAAYLCLDNSDVVLLGSDGSRKTPEISRWPLVVSFEKTGDGKLILSGSETWSGANFC